MDEKKSPIRLDIKTFPGDFLVWRRTQYNNLKKMPRIGGGGIPKYRHKTFAEAEIEAKKLAKQFPESVFVIIQEVASVKVKNPVIEVAEDVENAEA